MTRNMYIAVIILLLLFAGCGIFILMLQRDELQKNTQFYLIRNKLQNHIKFDSVSVPLSNTAVVNGIEIKSSPTVAFKNKTDRLIIKEYEETKTIPSFLSVEAKGIGFSLLDMARSLKLSHEDIREKFNNHDPVSGIFEAPLQSLLLAGCDKIKADADLIYAYSPDTQKLSVAVTARDKCLGIWQLSAAFDHITNAQQGRLVTALQNFLKKGYPYFDIEEFFKGAVITNFHFSYTETGLVKGYKNYIDALYLRLPDQPSPAELDIKDVQKIVSYLSFSNAHRQRNAEIAKTIGNFIKEPGKITIQSKNGKQVPLKILSGDFPRKLTEMLLRLDASVTLESQNK